MKPLSGRVIAVTRPKGQEKSLMSRLSDLGGTVRAFPLISIHPIYSELDLKSAINRLSDYDWICFTSANGVNLVLEFAKTEGLLEKFKDARIACIGSGTEETLKQWGFQAGLVPEVYRAEGLSQAFQKAGIKGKKFILLRAKGARDVLRDELVRGGGEALELPIYEALPNTEGIRELKSMIQKAEIDCITFTSSSTVLSFKQIVDEIGKRDILTKQIHLASIGPITSETLRQMGLPADIEAKTFTAEGLADAIEEFYRN